MRAASRAAVLMASVAAMAHAFSAAAPKPRAEKASPKWRHGHGAWDVTGVAGFSAKNGGHRPGQSVRAAQRNATKKRNQAKHRRACRGTR